MTTVAPDVIAAYDKRINSLDRRLTKVETTMTTITPHLATKADLNNQLRWVLGAMVGVAALLYNAQGRMEDRLNQRMDRIEQRLERVEHRSEQRFEELKQLIVQSRPSPPQADASSP